ncbi:MULTISPECIES: type II toxin-antitoxin system death-on-curing family toxin [Chitinophagaceae]
MILNYFTSEYAIKIHDKIIQLSGGLKGVKEIGNIESPLTHIQNDDYYPSFEEKITHLMFSFNKFHAFTDGNKRTSIGLAAFFLEINGLDIFVDKFIIEMENIAVLVADNIVDKDLLQEIINSIINEENYGEYLKLRIVNAFLQMNSESMPTKMGVGFYKDLY